MKIKNVTKTVFYILCIVSLIVLIIKCRYFYTFLLDNTEQALKSLTLAVGVGIGWGLIVGGILSSVFEIESESGKKHYIFLIAAGLLMLILIVSDIVFMESKYESKRRQKNSFMQKREVFDQKKEPFVQCSQIPEEKGKSGSFCPANSLNGRYYMYRAMSSVFHIGVFVFGISTLLVLHFVEKAWLIGVFISVPGLIIFSIAILIIYQGINIDDPVRILGMLLGGLTGAVAGYLSGGGQFKYRKKREVKLRDGFIEYISTKVRNNLINVTFIGLVFVSLLILTPFLVINPVGMRDVIALITFFAIGIMFQIYPWSAFGFHKAREQYK